MQIVLEQFEIVIRFEQEHLRASHAFDNEFGRVAEIGEETHLHPVHVKKQSHRIVRVMRHTERLDGDVTDIEAGFGAENAAIESHLKETFDCLLGEAIAVNRNGMYGAETDQPLDVIGMFVRDDDAR